MDANPSLSPEALAALLDGRKIEAIRIVRSQTGLGLREAKYLVERYIDQNPGAVAKALSAVKVESAKKVEKSNKTESKPDHGDMWVVKWLAIATGLVLLAYWVLS